MFFDIDPDILFDDEDEDDPELDFDEDDLDEDDLDEDDVDMETLRDDLRDHFGAYVGLYSDDTADIDIETASDEELFDLAEDAGFDLEDYME
ncbi:MAG: hypothetical protein J6F31_03750 [Oscillospiraceae bacterium]|nr:hypothetical protein [Oscillospiraceae bacterium]